MTALSSPRPVERISLTLSAGAVAAALAAGSPLFALSVAAGALIETANFRALWRLARHVFTGDLAGGGAWRAGFGLRFVLLAVAVFVALRAGAHPVGLVVGLSAIVPAVLIEAWRGRPRPGDFSPLPAPPPDDPSWERWDAWLARERPEPDEDEEP